MVARPKLRPIALFLVLFLLGALAAGNYFILHQAPFGQCPLDGMAFGTNLFGVPADPVIASCRNYLYYFIGAPLVVGLLLLLILPNLVTARELMEEKKPVAAPTPTKAAPPPPPTKPTADAAVQLLALLQREGRLVDFLREDIQPYDDAQVGAAVRTIHDACRQVLTEHLTLEPVLRGSEGDEVTVPKDFDPSSVRLTGNVTGEPPFRGALRHAGWRAAQVKLPTLPSGQDPKIVAPAEVEIP